MNFVIAETNTEILNVASALLSTGKVRMASSTPFAGGSSFDEATAKAFAAATLTSKNVVGFGPVEYSAVTTPKLVGNDKVNLPDGRFDVYRRVEFKMADGTTGSVKCKVNVCAALLSGTEAPVTFSMGALPNDPSKFWVAAHTTFSHTEEDLQNAIAPTV